MYKTLLVTAVILVSVNTTAAEPPADELATTLTAVIRKHCPDAKIEVTKAGFVAKSGTMRFTVHRRSKTGEVSSETYQEEGPNFKGFILRVSVSDGKYLGAAAVPTTLQGPYFPTFVDAPAVSKVNKHYWISFSYGSRLDPDLKKAIFEAIPATRTDPGAPQKKP